MLSSVLLLSSLVASVAASNYTLPSDFNITAVSLATRNSWCTAERNSCPMICGGVADSNTCDGNTLDFTCVCSNGTSADVEPYKNTIPYFVCEANYGQCVEAHPNDLDGQEKCKEEATCGTIEPSDSTSSTTSSSAVASATASSTATSEDSSSSSSSTTSSTSTATAASAANVVLSHPTSLLATALFLAAGLVL